MMKIRPVITFAIAQVALAREHTSSRSTELSDATGTMNAVQPHFGKGICHSVSQKGQQQLTMLHKMRMICINVTANNENLARPSSSNAETHLNILRRPTT